MHLLCRAAQCSRGSVHSKEGCGYMRQRVADSPLAIPRIPTRLPVSELTTRARPLVCGAPFVTEVRRCPLAFVLYMCLPAGANALRVWRE